MRDVTALSMSALGDSERKVLTALSTKKKKITFLYPKKSLDIDSDLKGLASVRLLKLFVKVLSQKVVLSCWAAP